LKVVKEIPVKGSKQRLMGTDVFYEEEKGALPVVIYIHGFNGLKDWGNFDLIAKQFAAAGFFFVKMNMSHNGATLDSPLEFADPEAFGQNNYTTELFDVEQILNWVCNPENPFQELINPDKIMLLGHSRGGGIAILKASEDKRVKGLITWASIAECKTPWGSMAKVKMDAWKAEGVMYYTNQRTKQRLPMYYQLFEDYKANEERLNIRKAISTLTIPVLICHGTNDPAVPYSKALDLHRWQPHSTLVSVDADHVFGRSHPWTSDLLPQPMQTIVDESMLFLKQNFADLR